MFGIYFKYFFIILCSIYIFIKLQTIRIKWKQIIIHIPIAAIFALAACFSRQNCAYLTLILIVLLLTMFLYITCKKPMNKIIPFTIISIGISYIAYIISSFMIAPICYIILSRLIPNGLTTTTFFIIGLFQITLCYFLFRIKRFRNGIAAYESKLTSELGVFISISLLLLVTLYNNQKVTDFFKTILLIFILLVGFLLLLWWKTHITNIYLEKLHKRNIEILENELSIQKEENNALKKHNEELSKIIHKDNKLIPAMEFAVEEILNCQSEKEQKEKSKSLLMQLKTMSSERAGIIADYEISNKQLSETGIASLDASLKYLLSRSKKQNISFDLSVATDIRNVTSNIVTEDDLNTLLLDLGENAIIAASAMHQRNVLIIFGMENQSFCMNIYDSGAPFAPSVIANLGLKRVTTHKETGGSGIGLMTTAELLKKYKASFCLDETIAHDSYHKKISICFDGAHQYRIQTQREEILKILKNRKDIFLL